MIITFTQRQQLTNESQRRANAGAICVGRLCQRKPFNNTSNCMEALTKRQRKSNTRPLRTNCLNQFASYAQKPLICVHNNINSTYRAKHVAGDHIRHIHTLDVREHSTNLFGVLQTATVSADLARRTKTKKEDLDDRRLLFIERINKVANLSFKLISNLLHLCTLFCRLNSKKKEKNQFIESKSTTHTQTNKNSTNQNKINKQTNNIKKYSKQTLHKTTNELERCQTSKRKRKIHSLPMPIS
jgi:hypothetical protein